MTSARELRLGFAVFAVIFMATGFILGYVLHDVIVKVLP